MSGPRRRPSDFVQFEPRRGDPAVEAHASVCHLRRRPSLRRVPLLGRRAVTAQLTQRDADLFSDDAVAVLLDTLPDRQTAYYFMTNPLGTQMDGRLADDGRQTDKTWDAPWPSAAQRTDYGWSAEFAIPFTSIKYASGAGTTWGINFGRTRRARSNSARGRTRSTADSGCPRRAGWWDSTSTRPRGATR